MTSRGPFLKSHFSKNPANLALPKDDQFAFISHPELHWFHVDARATIFRHIGSFSSPEDFMNALWNNAIIDHICNETKPLKLEKKNVKLTRSDVRKFFGVELMRGDIGIRNIEHMWSTGDIQINYPGKESSLGKNHWFAISNGIDFQPDSLHQSLTQAYQKHLVPGYNVTVDELRIPYTHEACPFKNHNRDKPDIWAIESKSLHADNGYLVDFINPCQDKVPTPAESLMLFAENLKWTERRHHVIADSNFLSVLDLPKLEEMNVDATISCKGNRPSFIWKEGLALNLPKGYTRVASSKRVCCLATNNKGMPKIATTRCVAVENPFSSDVKERSDVLKLYDNDKGNADKFGHLYKSQFPIGFHMNWKTSLLVGWFYFSFTNAYILYSMRFNEHTHASFVYQVAINLLTK